MSWHFTLACVTGRLSSTDTRTHFCTWNYLISLTHKQVLVAFNEIMTLGYFLRINVEFSGIMDFSKKASLTPFWDFVTLLLKGLRIDHITNDTPKQNKNTSMSCSCTAAELHPYMLHLSKQSSDVNKTREYQILSNMCSTVCPTVYLLGVNNVFENILGSSNFLVCYLYSTY